MKAGEISLIPYHHWGQNNRASIIASVPCRNTPIQSASANALNAKHPYWDRSVVGEYVTRIPRYLGRITKTRAALS